MKEETFDLTVTKSGDIFIEGKRITGFIKLGKTYYLFTKNNAYQAKNVKKDSILKKAFIIYRGQRITYR